MQQRIIGGNQIIVDQQGNRQLVPNQNIVITNPQTTVNVNQNVKDIKKPVMGSPPHSQANVTPQKIIISTSQQFPNLTFQQSAVDNQQNNQNTVVRTIQNTENTPPVGIYYIMLILLSTCLRLLFNLFQKLPPVSPRKIPDEPWVCLWRGCDTLVCLNFRHITLMSMTSGVIFLFSGYSKAQQLFIYTLATYIALVQNRLVYGCIAINFHGNVFR